MESNRFKRIQITPKAFFQTLIQGVNFKCTKGIPEDSEFRGCSFDPISGCWQVYVEHPSYEPVIAGQMIPELWPVQFETIRPDDEAQP